MHPGADDELSPPRRCRRVLGSPRAFASAAARGVGLSVTKTSQEEPSSGANLRRAKRKAVAMHLKVAAMLWAAAFILGLVSLTMFVAKLFASFEKSGPFALWICCVATGGMLILLSFPPKHKRAIRFTAIVGAMFAVVMVLVACALLLGTIGECSAPHEAIAGNSSVASPAPTSAACLMWSVHFGLAAIAYVCVVVGWLYFPLRRNRDGSWAFSARQVLNGVWLVYRTFLTAWGTVEVLLFLVSGIVDPYARAIPPVVREHFTDFGREPFLGGREYVCWLVLVPLVFLSIAALSSLRLRRRYVAFLMRLAAKDSALSASAIAAMVSGGGGVGRALKTAAATFRVLPLASLTEADLTSNADTGLNEKVVAASLGECSCFMSHSWRDNGQAKWVLLHEWAEIHREIAKTEPTIWLGMLAHDATHGTFAANADRAPMLASRSWQIKHALTSRRLTRASRACQSTSLPARRCSSWRDLRTLQGYGV